MHTEFNMAETSPVIDPEEANDKNFRMFSHYIIGMAAEGFFLFH